MVTFLLICYLICVVYNYLLYKRICIELDSDRWTQGLRLLGIILALFGPFVTLFLMLPFITHGRWLDKDASW